MAAALGQRHSDPNVETLMHHELDFVDELAIIQSRLGNDDRLSHGRGSRRLCAS